MEIARKWVSNEAENYEKVEVKKISAKIIEKKMVRKYKKREGGEIDSEDDDLNGWNFREY